MIIKGKNHCPKNVQSFLNDVMFPYLVEYDKTCEFRRTKTLRIDGGYCSGYCDDDKIVIAAEGPRADFILIHEFAHMIQNVDKDPHWVNFKFKNNKINWGDWGDIKKCLDVEHDAESRALDLNDRHEVFNIAKTNSYISTANLYLFFYQYCFVVGEFAYSAKLWKNSKKIKHYLRKNLKNGNVSLVDREKLEIIDMNLMQLYHDALM